MSAADPSKRPAMAGEAWLQGLDPAAARILAELRTGSPELVDLLTEVLYEKVFQRPRLDIRTKCLLAVCCAAAGGFAPQVRYQARLALRCGVPIEDLYEMCFFVAAFCGLSQAMNAMNLINAANLELAAEADGQAS